MCERLCSLDLWRSCSGLSWEVLLLFGVGLLGGGGVVMDYEVLGCVAVWWN